ncbi:MAG: o-succinylbenzoate synthase [Candidatus Didemnitutus sp.]|nr:o-succinylbenzoate synthase [Candidatus Didemnitutus sp.]
MRYRFHCKSYRFAFAQPLRTVHGLWTEREGIYVRLTSSDGRVGYGEIAPLAGFANETLAEAAEVCRRLGDDVTDDELDAVASRCACTRFALAAARSAAPLAAEAKRLPVAALLPAGRAVLDALPERLAAGFLCCKWKVGVGRAEDELVLLDDVLALLPPYVTLRLDANGSWDRRTASRWLAACAERPVEFVEQPLAPDDGDGLRGLADDFPVRLALDEAVAGLDSAREWQARGWRGVFVIKPALAGPLPELQEWLAKTKPDVVFSSAIETALGRAQLLRALLPLEATTRALGFGVGDIFGDRRCDGPVIGPLLDASWCDMVDAEELWNAVN